MSVIVQYYEEFSDVTSVTITHNLGYKPIVMVQWADGVGGYTYRAISTSVRHVSTNQFVVDFGSYTMSGRITYV